MLPPRISLKRHDSSIAPERPPTVRRRLTGGVPAPGRLPTAARILLFASALAALAVAVLAPDAPRGAGVPPPNRLPLPVLMPGAEAPTRFVLVLEGEPITGGSKQEEITVLRARQDAVAARVVGAGGTVISRYEAVLNGLLVDLSPDARAAVAKVPQVRRIWVAPRMQAALFDSVPFIGARRVVDDLGFDGTGAVIAVVDSGIDYTHAALGGAGDPAAYAADNPDIVESGTFPSVKVIGGWDFAGTLYDPGCSIPDEAAGACRRSPVPDADPIDEQGHGTSVASIAAGVGAGAGDVGPGVAPGAGLVALKVLGARGGTDILLDALEWIVRARTGLPVPGVAARVDVVNISLGSAYASGLYADEGVIRRLTASGVVVVAAAGNDGDRPYIVSSPAAADLALAVGASFDDGEANLAIEATWTDQGGGTLRAEGVETAFTEPLAEVGAIEAPAAWMGTACPGAPAAGPARDKIALVDRTGCSAFEKVQRARDLGAVAVVLYTDDRLVEVVGADGRVAIPAVMISAGDGLRLRALLERGVAVGISLDPGRIIPHPELADGIAPDSSRGPAPDARVPKPDLSAPGTSIWAAGMGTGTGADLAAGTSMAAPHAAGVAALVRGVRPELPAADVARLVTGGVVPVGDGRSGAGRLDAWTALSNESFVTAPNSLSAVSFGRISAPGTITQTVQLTNLGARSKRFRVEAASPPRPGAAFTLGPKDVMVTAGGQTSLEAVIEVGPAYALGPGPVRGGGNVALGDRLGALEHRGRMTAVEVDDAGVPVAGGDRIQVPLVARLEPASQATVRGSVPNVTAAGGLGPATFTVENRGAAVAPVDAYLWFGDDGADPFVDPRIDIRHVGARMTRDAGGARVLEIAALLGTSAPAPVGLALSAYLDTDADGDLDWLAVGLDAEVLFNGVYSGEWATVVAPFAEGSVVPDWSRAVAEYYGDVRLDGAYAVLRVRPSTIGLRSAPGAAPPVQFFVAAEDRLWSGEHSDVVDVAPGAAGLTSPDHLWTWHWSAAPLAVWPWTAQVASGGTGLFRVAASRGRTDAAAPPPQGVLFLYPSNTQGAAAPDLPGEAFEVTVPDHLAALKPAAYLPATTRSGR